MIRKVKETHVEKLETEAIEQCASCIRTLMRKTVRDMNDVEGDEFKITLNIVGAWDCKKPTVLELTTTGKSETKLVHTDETVAYKLNTDPKQLTLPGTEE